MPLDKSIKEEKLEEYLWADFCMIGIFNGVDKDFIISSNIIGIEKSYSKPYFEMAYKNGEETLG